MFPFHHGNSGVESPQAHSAIMLQGGPHVLHPMNRGRVVSGLLSPW